MRRDVLILERVHIGRGRLEDRADLRLLLCGRVGVAQGVLHAQLDAIGHVLGAHVAVPTAHRVDEGAAATDHQHQRADDGQCDDQAAKSAARRLRRARRG